MFFFFQKYRCKNLFKYIIQSCFNFSLKTLLINHDFFVTCKLAHIMNELDFLLMFLRYTLFDIKAKQIRMLYVLIRRDFVEMLIEKQR